MSVAGCLDELARVEGDAGVVTSIVGGSVRRRHEVVGRPAVPTPARVLHSSGKCVAAAGVGHRGGAVPGRGAVF